MPGQESLELKEMFQDDEWKREFKEIINEHICESIKETVRDTLPLLVRTVVRKELKDNPQPHDCKFTGINNKDAEQISKYVGLLSEMNDGKLIFILESAHDTLKWIEGKRKTGRRLEIAVYVFLALSAAGGILPALSVGIKSLLRGVAQ